MLVVIAVVSGTCTNMPTHTHTHTHTPLPNCHSSSVLKLAVNVCVCAHKCVVVQYMCVCLCVDVSVCVFCVYLHMFASECVSFCVSVCEQEKPISHLRALQAETQNGCRSWTIKDDWDQKITITHTQTHTDTHTNTLIRTLMHIHTHRTWRVTETDIHSYAVLSVIIFKV